MKITGVDRGLKDAHYVFEAVLDDLAPMLREMPNSGSSRDAQETIDSGGASDFIHRVQSGA